MASLASATGPNERRRLANREDRLDGMAAPIRRHPSVARCQNRQ
jgi:hypothetical protein